eukprot:gene54037-72218_t
MLPTITDTPSLQDARYVFVYGTLRRGERLDINRLQPMPVFIGNAQIKGTLYDLGRYPGLRLGGVQWVQGEVYQITPELERQLDEIEEVWPQQTGEYVKREVAVQCAGRELMCLVYAVSAKRLPGCAVIESGDWDIALQWLQNHHTMQPNNNPSPPTLPQLLALAAALSVGAAVSLGITRFAYGLLLPSMRADLGWSYTL